MVSHKRHKQSVSQLKLDVNIRSRRKNVGERLYASREIVFGFTSDWLRTFSLRLRLQAENALSVWHRFVTLKPSSNHTKTFIRCLVTRFYVIWKRRFSQLLTFKCNAKRKQTRNTFDKRVKIASEKPFHNNMHKSFPQIKFTTHVADVRILYLVHELGN